MTRLVAMALIVGIALTSCGGGNTALRNAATRFATNVGSTADDVINHFRGTYDDLADNDLVRVIDDAADRTSWMDDLAVRIAQQQELATTRAIAGATCDVMQAAADAGGWENLTEDHWYEIVAGQIRYAGLAETRGKVKEVQEAIDRQLQSLHDSGAVTIDIALRDMACFAI